MDHYITDFTIDDLEQALESSFNHRDKNRFEEVSKELMRRLRVVSQNTVGIPSDCPRFTT